MEKGERERVKGGKGVRVKGGGKRWKGQGWWEKREGLRVEKGEGLRVKGGKGVRLRVLGKEGRVKGDGKRGKG